MLRALISAGLMMVVLSLSACRDPHMSPSENDVLGCIVHHERSLYIDVWRLECREDMYRCFGNRGIDCFLMEDF